MKIELTGHQKAVIVGVSRNEDFKTIAQRLKVSTSMVGNVITRIYDKLGFRGTVALTHWAIQNKLVKLGDYEK